MFSAAKDEKPFSTGILLKSHGPTGAVSSVMQKQFDLLRSCFEGLLDGTRAALSTWESLPPTTEASPLGGPCTGLGGLEVIQSGCVSSDAVGCSPAVVLSAASGSFFLVWARDEHSAEDLRWAVWGSLESSPGILSPTLVAGL